MAKRGGFPGGMPGNMNNLMKQAQKMQKQMEEAQKELELKEVEAAAGGGAVKAKVNGKKELVSLTIDPDAVDPDDVEMLEDMIVAAVNEAMREMDNVSQASMSKITGGLGGFGVSLGGLCGRLSKLRITRRRFRLICLADSNIGRGSSNICRNAGVGFGRVRGGNGLHRAHFSGLCLRLRLSRRSNGRSGAVFNILPKNASRHSFCFTVLIQHQK